jgi:hypothetical protein
VSAGQIAVQLAATSEPVKLNSFAKELSITVCVKIHNLKRWIVLQVTAEYASVSGYES